MPHPVAAVLAGDLVTRGRLRRIVKDMDLAVPLAGGVSLNFDLDLGDECCDGGDRARTTKRFVMPRPACSTVEHTRSPTAQTVFGPGSFCSRSFFSAPLPALHDRPCPLPSGIVRSSG
jgi:hypothetical protein